MTVTTGAPAQAPNVGRGQAPAALPFAIASRQQSRQSFVTPTTALSATSPTLLSPIQIPAVGYLRFIRLEVTLTGSGGTSPAFLADGPFNVIQSINLRNASGNDLIVPLTGYQLYLANKYGAQTSQAPLSDKRLGRQYAAAAPSAHFFLDVPLEIDSQTGLGAIPALASNRSYQLAITLAAIPTVLSGAPSVSVTIDATAFYWTEPIASTQSGVPQTTQPPGLGTISLWQIESPPVTPGDKYIRSNNVGNVIRCLIFVLRNSAGARIDVNGWPTFTELYMDNDPLFRLKQTEHEQLMAEWYNLQAAAKDVPGGLDTGVYVLPFFGLTAGYAGDPSATRAQLLPTLDASLLQLRGNFGSAVSTLEILTNGVVPKNASVLYSK